MCGQDPNLALHLSCFLPMVQSYFSTRAQDLPPLYPAAQSSRPVRLGLGARFPTESLTPVVGGVELNPSEHHCIHPSPNLMVGVLV